MARKKKKIRPVNENATLEEWSEGDSYVGTPTMVLLPAKNFYFRILNAEFKITVPREGMYKELDEDFYTEEDGGFCLFDEDSKVMYLPAISKVLFGTKKYPNLEANQLFAPVALIFNEDTVEIIGQLLEMLDPSDK